MTTRNFNRRDLLKLGSQGLALHFLSRFATPAQGAAGVPKLLFVLTASGGASIMDSLLPILQSESNDAGLNTFTAAQLTQPAGSNFRCVVPFNNSIQGAIALGTNYPIATFLTKHKDDVVVMTQEGTSVNHFVAARRALTGNNVNGGRTLMEAAALHYGKNLLLPNCNLASAGYNADGEDPSVPAFARAEPIADPLTFALTTHGARAVKGAPPVDRVNAARELRKRVEAASPFGQTFVNSRLLKDYVVRRDSLTAALERGDLIAKLNLMQSVPGGIQLKDYGLDSSPDLPQLLEKFPNIVNDPLDAQAALAFLLTRYGVSCAVTFGPGQSPVFQGAERLVTPPIAFDWSHNDHRGAQNAMWSRIFQVADGLIDLLKATDYGGNPENGKMWDHSLIYIATEFGRDKRLAGGGSGHHLNNGNVLISPLLKGNKVYGGIDPNTGLTFGFDPATGAPDPARKMTEGHLYSAICHALGVPFARRIDMPCMVRGA